MFVFSLMKPSIDRHISIWDFVRVLNLLGIMSWVHDEIGSFASPLSRGNPLIVEPYKHEDSFPLEMNNRLRMEGQTRI